MAWAVCAPAPDWRFGNGSSGTAFNSKTLTHEPLAAADWYPHNKQCCQTGPRSTVLSPPRQEASFSSVSSMISTTRQKHQYHQSLNFKHVTKDTSTHFKLNKKESIAAIYPSNNCNSFPSLRIKRRPPPETRRNVEAQRVKQVRKCATKISQKIWALLCCPCNTKNTAPPISFGPTVVVITVAVTPRLYL